ncbi:alcohol dehydrogenase catalytic domain-containing protein, partial [Streptomyces lasiicapitis]|uniref:alcohol dehydrogenase catalytic domain-containing protein n=1 Tax=Streptomyces lasiicapitis TaxID=1923961 RepID=UPI0036C155F2
MKALVKEKAEPGLRLMDVPEPVIGAGDVLIKVLRTGICGTDLHIRAWDGWAQQTIAAPLIVGHEFVGEVVETGRDVVDIKAGDRVSGEGHLVCGKCRNCQAGRRHLCRATVGLGVGRDGAFAEYVALPASNVWVHRVQVDLDVAAIFDPFGNAVHTALSFPL